MPHFSKNSEIKLESCHPELVELFLEVVRHFDCTIIEGYRDRARQNRLYQLKRTRLQYPDSWHNNQPSLAVDVAPYPIEWGNIFRFYFFAGIVKGVAIMKGIPITWGGDWDNDTMIKDNRFNDLVHYQLSREV